MNDPSDEAQRARDHAEAIRRLGITLPKGFGERAVRRARDSRSPGRDR